MNQIELDQEQAVALPDREALSRFRLSFNLVSANSTATAVNAVTLLSAATAVSGNFISIG